MMHQSHNERCKSPIRKMRSLQGRLSEDLCQSESPTSATRNLETTSKVLESRLASLKRRSLKGTRSPLSLGQRSSTIDRRKVLYQSMAKEIVARSDPGEHECTSVRLRRALSQGRPIMAINAWGSFRSSKTENIDVNNVSVPKLEANKRDSVTMSEVRQSQGTAAGQRPSGVDFQARIRRNKAGIRERVSIRRANSSASLERRSLSRSPSRTRLVRRTLSESNRGEDRKSEEESKRPALVRSYAIRRLPQRSISGPVGNSSSFGLATEDCTNTSNSKPIVGTARSSRSSRALDTRVRSLSPYHGMPPSRTTTPPTTTTTATIERDNLTDNSIFHNNNQRRSLRRRTKSAECLRQARQSIVAGLSFDHDQDSQDAQRKRRSLLLAKSSSEIFHDRKKHLQKHILEQKDLLGLMAAACNNPAA